MTQIPNLPAAPVAPRPWWMTAVVTGQTTNARLPLSHLGSLPRGAILVSLANYLADTASTSAGDPGAGNLRWNDATQADATKVFISDVDADTTDYAALWATLNTGGYLYLYDPADLDVWQEWQITGVADESGYVALDLTLQGSNGDFADEDAVVATIQQPNPAAGVDRNVVTTVTSTGNTTTCNASLGDYFKTTLSEDTTLALSNVPAACTLHIQATQGAVDRTLAFPAGWDWGAGESAPTMPTGAGEVLDIIFTTNDNGATGFATARVRS